MHQMKRPTRLAFPKRILAGLTLALCLSTVAVVFASDDPVEALCALYDYPDAMWFFLMCWRFDPAQNLMGG